MIADDNSNKLSTPNPYTMKHSIHLICINMTREYMQMQEGGASSDKK